MRLIPFLLALLLLAGCATSAVPETLPETAPVTEATVAEMITQTTPATESPTQPTEAAVTGFDTVPVYFQSDYPFVRYGNGTIASSGCSMTCLAMAASYCCDREYTPDALVWAFGSYGSTNKERLEYAIGQMQLPCEKNTDWRITKQALQEGAIAIVLVDERSEFTNSAHFILLTGINEAGRYEVIDPFKPNYSEDYLEAGFEKGFTEGQILAGLEGSWVFRKEDMGTFRYEIVMPDFEKTRYSDYRPTDADREFLARFVWAAARNEPPEVQQAIAEVVLNRVASPRFPYLVEQVVQQEDLQVWYQQMDRAQPDIPQYAAVTNAVYGPHILPANVCYAAPWLKNTGTEWGQLGSFTFLYTR